jgi:hypothetical protein
MSNRRYASWVKGGYLLWAEDEEYKNQEFHESAMHDFLTREESKTNLATLSAIAQIQSNSILTTPINEYKSLEIADLLQHEIEHHYERYGSIRKKELNRAVDQFRKASTRLCNTLNYTHSYRASELIEDAPDIWKGNPTTDMDEHDKNLTESLKVFWGKTVEQVLLEYADRVEFLGTGNHYFLINNREPTTSQIKIRLTIYLVIAMIDIDATEEIEGIGALITHMMIISSTEYEELNVDDVNKQVITAIKICKEHGKPITIK